MSFNLNSLETNKSAEKDGVWIDYLDGSKLKIARIGNQGYKAFMTTKYKQNRMAIDRNDRGADEIAEKIQLEALANHILVDWKGIEFDGKDQKYTPEFGLKVLKEIADFRKDVENYASDSTLYRDATHADDKDSLKK